jgi:rod shape-determining protein MreD
LNPLLAADRAYRLALWRARLVPPFSTIAASAMPVLPVMASAPVLPPFGLLMLLSWRMIRPELWPAWVGLPLGLADDLLGGQPIGTAMALWTLVLLALDQIDPRMMIRDYWFEWLLTASAVAFVLAGSLLLQLLSGGAGSLKLLGVPMLAAVLVFPAVARLCAVLDRWRLRK